MTRQSTTCLQSWRHKQICLRGMTLIEVVVGLAILGSLLTTAVFAKARYTRQWNRANQQLEAIEMADALLTNWWTDPTTFPRSDTGEASNDPQLVWQTHTMSQVGLDESDGQVVRLEIHDRRTPDHEEPLISVDLVLPVEADEDEQ